MIAKTLTDKGDVVELHDAKRIEAEVGKYTVDVSDKGILTVHSDGGFAYGGTIEEVYEMMQEKTGR